MKLNRHVLAGFLIATTFSIRADEPGWQKEILRARQLQRAANYGEAESILTQAVETAPDEYSRARTLTAFGSGYQDLGRFADADRPYRPRTHSRLKTIQ